MKKMRISLNGKVYDVTVEILEDDETHYPGASPMAMPTTRPAAPIQSATRPQRPADAGSNAVLAPIVGTVNKILVKAGQAVKENEPLIVLDAMKMDTYINSPRQGTVASLECQLGDSVQVGQKLLLLK